MMELYFSMVQGLIYETSQSPLLYGYIVPSDRESAAAAL
jgi:hypothetical protein